MKTYRIMNRITHEVDQVSASDADGACRRLGWRLGECWVVELPPRKLPARTGYYVNSPKPPTRKPY